MNNKYLTKWITVMISIFFNACSHDSAQRLLAVGGIHVFESKMPCSLVHVKPQDAVTNLKWDNTLAIEAKTEGDAEVMCEQEQIKLKIITPARIEIEMVSDIKPTEMVVEQRFQVRVHLYDRQGRELEVGKFTIFDWSTSGVVEVANDKSSGEFGFSSTSFGMHSFRAINIGEGLITARLGKMEGKIKIITTL